MGLIKQVVLVGASGTLASVALLNGPLTNPFADDPNEDVKQVLEALELQDERLDIEADILVKQAELRVREQEARATEKAIRDRIDSAREKFPELMAIVESKTDDLSELDFVATQLLNKD